MNHILQLPPFKLKNVDGKIYSDTDFLNKKALLIIFTCNHCPYVIAYNQRITQLYNKFASPDFSMITINSNDPVKYPQDSFENMIKFSNQMKLKFPYLFDNTQEIAQVFKAQRTPESFLYNGKKELVYHGTIDDNWKDEASVTIKYLENAVLAVLEDKQVSIKETQPVGCSIKWK